MDAARLHRLGFPESVPLAEFERRFGLLAGECSKDIVLEQILSANEIDPATYRIGPSQVSGVLFFMYRFTKLLCEIFTFISIWLIFNWI